MTPWCDNVTIIHDDRDPETGMVLDYGKVVMQLCLCGNVYRETASFSKYEPPQLTISKCLLQLAKKVDFHENYHERTRELVDACWRD